LLTSGCRWLIAKAYDAPLLIGPAMLAMSAVQDLESINMHASINGDIIMECVVSEMIDDLAACLAQVSKFSTAPSLPSSPLCPPRIAICPSPDKNRITVT